MVEHKMGMEVKSSKNEVFEYKVDGGIFPTVLTPHIRKVLDGKLAGVKMQSRVKMTASPIEDGKCVVKAVVGIVKEGVITDMQTSEYVFQTNGSGKFIKVSQNPELNAGLSNGSYSRYGLDVTVRDLVGNVNSVLEQHIIGKWNSPTSQINRVVPILADNFCNIIINVGPKNGKHMIGL